jgi:Uma2 family endonuclease
VDSEVRIERVVRCFMGRVAERSQLTAAEYLAWEREQPIKHEFFHGEVFATAGGKPRHNALGVSTGAELRAALRSRGCSVLSSDQRIAFPPEARYVYPDVTVICGPPVFQHGTNDVIANPSILVESCRARPRSTTAASSGPGTSASAR